MTTKEFIECIASGTFSNNDVIMQAASFPYKEDLIWDLWMADKGCQESTGRPQVTDEVQISRITNAISILCEEYQINPFENESHKVPTPITIPEELDTDLFRAFLVVAIQQGIIEILSNTVKFKRGNALLAFACGAIFCGDHVTIDTVTRENVIKRGYCALLPQKQLSSFFGVNRLSQSRNQIIGKAPMGYEEIEQILRRAETIAARE